MFFLVQPHRIFFDDHRHRVVAQDQDDLSMPDLFDQYSATDLPSTTITLRPMGSPIDDPSYLDVSGWVARRHKLYRNDALTGFSPSRKGAVFVWRHATRMSDPSNWVNRDVACDGDWLRVDAQRIFVASLDGGLKVKIDKYCKN